MSNTKPRAYPRYDEICHILEYGAHIGKTFPVSFCQNLLAQIETYAQEAQELPQVKALCLELMAYITTLPYKDAKEHEARTALLERAERILHDGPDDGSN
jgi:hypothetical protein